MRNKSFEQAKAKLNDFYSKVDKNFVYLGITILIILIIMIFQSLNVPYTDYDFGYCNYKITCKGIRLGEICIGSKVKSAFCLNPANTTEEYRRIELNCGLIANSICKDPEISGFEWITLSEYEGKSCEEWKTEYNEIKLLSCNQTFADVTQYSTLR